MSSLTRLLHFFFLFQKQSARASKPRIPVHQFILNFQSFVYNFPTLKLNIYLDKLEAREKIADPFRTCKCLKTSLSMKTWNPTFGSQASYVAHVWLMQRFLPITSPVPEHPDIEASRLDNLLLPEWMFFLKSHFPVAPAPSNFQMLSSDSHALYFFGSTFWSIKLKNRNCDQKCFYKICYEQVYQSRCNQLIFLHNITPVTDCSAGF